MTQDVLDVIIVGGGPAGLSAAVFAARRGLSTMILSQDIGGQASTTSLIENYPGIDRTDGLTLMTAMKEQGEKYGAIFHLAEVTKIERQKDMFRVSTTAETYTSRTVILAFGLTHRRLNVPGEERFIGRGVSYCATCDAPSYQGKRVVVVGGGNSAMDAALVAAEFASQVDLVTHHPEFHGEKVLRDRVAAHSNVTTHMTTKTIAVEGEESVTGVTMMHDGQTTTIPCDGVFVEVGFTIAPKLIEHLVALDDRRQVIIDPATNGTDVPGLFAAGDVTTIPQKQIVISAGEGAKAALGAYHYLQALGHAAASGNVDWGVQTPLHHEHLPPTDQTHHGH